MTNKVIDIPLKLVVVEDNRYGQIDYKLTTTPVSIETLLGPIYQLKPGITLHRINAKNRAVTAKALAGENTIIVKESSDTIEYINKDDLEPYELSDYDKQRLAKYDNKQNKLKFFNDMLFPSIKALINTYNCVLIRNNKNEIELSFNYAYATDNDKATKIKAAKEIVSKIKDLCCHITYHRCSNNLATIHKIKTVDNLQKLPE
jgi:hypothetical protein